MKITYIGLDNCLPLKTLSLRQRQINQHTTLTPIRIIFLMDLDTSLSQLPKMFLALRGRGILKAKKHTSPNKLSDMTLKEKMLDCLLCIAERIMFAPPPPNFLLTRLSFVRIIFL